MLFQLDTLSKLPSLALFSSVYVEKGSTRSAYALVSHITSSFINLNIPSPVSGILILLLLGSTVLLLIKRSLKKRRSRPVPGDALTGILDSLVIDIQTTLYIKDITGSYLFATDSWAHALGVDAPEDLYGKKDSDFLSQAQAIILEAEERNVLRSGVSSPRSLEVIEKRTGETVSLFITRRPLHNKQGDLIGVAGLGGNMLPTDSEQTVLNDEALRYKSIFDKAFIGIFQSTPDGLIVNANPAMAFILGYESAEAVIKDQIEFVRHFFVDTKRGVQFMMVMDKMGGVKNFECEIFQKDNSKIWVAMNIRGIRENGVVIRYEGMVEDITERIQLRSQLLQAQKLESVGQLAAGIAHEINTPAQYVDSNTHFLKESLKELRELFGHYEELFEVAKTTSNLAIRVRNIEEKIRSIDSDFLWEEIPKAIDQSLEGIDRITSLVTAMREFSHPGTKEKVLVDLNLAIHNATVVCRNEWKYVADLDTDLDQSLPIVPCYPGEFNQVILNLIVNAAHAVGDSNRSLGRDKGKITIRTRHRPNHVEILVEDTGTGIAPQIRGRVFDPFFTTKEIGKGTGQGLAIARSVIVDKHGGTIDFHSEEGQGTTFILHLPLNSKSIHTSEK